jgi:hypothetical protein
MVKRLPLLIAAFGMTALPMAADARPRDRDQDAAYRATKQGRMMPLPGIEARVKPRMRGAEHIGTELDSRAETYRLKFMREGRVIWVDVDARTGKPKGRAGE